MPTSVSLVRTQLAALAAAHGESYRTNQPFPHIVLEDFLSADLLDEVVAEFPDPASDRWFRFDSHAEKKLASLDDQLMGPMTRQLLAELNGAAMLDFLRDLTGIAGLVPDPSYLGGGLHQIEPGGFLEIHADFNVHPETRLYRRLNLLLYLNRGWEAEWGGDLELWDRSMSRCEVRVAPVFNRCVIFNTTQHSFHGHPEPVACPPGTTRKSIALYYYAREPDPTDDSTPHNTLFQRVDQPTAADAPGAGTVRRIARQLLPPIVVSGVRRASRRWRSSG